MSLRMQKILNLPFVDNSDFYRLCQAYISLLSYWNSIINLVSTHHVDNLLTDLIRQSVEPLATEVIPTRSKVLDVGSGAGFPGLPLKFARPDLKMTLLEPRRKKALFLKRVVQELNLNDVEVVRSRLEDESTRQDWQKAYNLVTTRGTGSASVLFPTMKPLIRPGGACWFYKGIRGRKEARDLSRIFMGPIRLLSIGRNLSVIILQFD